MQPVVELLLLMTVPTQAKRRISKFTAAMSQLMARGWSLLLEASSPSRFRIESHL